MKGPVLDASTFSFNATAKTVTFSAPIPGSQQQILAILNVTRQAWLYLPVQAGYGGTWASPTLTLTAPTTGHANGDTLQIFVDDGLASMAITAAALPLPSGAATAANQATSNSTLAAIDADLGTDGTSPPTLPSGSTGVRGWLRYLASLLPSLVSGRWPVDGSGVTQPVSPNITRGGGVLDANTQRVTMATDGPTVSSLTSLDSKSLALPTADAQTSVATSTTTVQLLAARTSRKRLLIFNPLGGAALSIGSATPVTTANTFLTIPAGNGVFLDQADFTGVAGAWYGLLASGTSTAQVRESY